MTVERPKLRKYAYTGDQLTEPPPEELAAILEAHVGEPDALITVLEGVQRRFDFLGEQQLRYVAQGLGFPLARVFGVATFYNLFRFDPPGKHQVRVCRGTACHVNGSALILHYLEDELGIGVDETTADGLFTLQMVACVGACSLAAVVVIGEQTHGRMTPDGTVEIVGELAAAEESA